jgi:hypothetical protein
MLVQVTLTLPARKRRSTDITTRLCQTSSARHHAPVAAAHSASLLGRTTRRKPASRCSACTARYGSLLGRTTRRKPASCYSARTARYGSLLGRTTRKPASRYTARTAWYGSLLGRTTGRPANCNTNAPFKGQRFTASQPTRGKLRPASSRHARLPSANRYALRPFSGPTNSATNWMRHNCPFQGQQTLQQASWHYENLAWLPWSSVTLIVNICYSGCLRTRVTTSHTSNVSIVTWIYFLL